MSAGATGTTVAAAEVALDRLAPEASLGIAVSGGGDSTALMALSAVWAAARGRRLAAATVDHGLRPESAAEARAVAALCARLAIDHTTLSAPDLRAGGGNLPASARDARYRLLADWARGRGLGVVLLGHTMDDLAETLLMRLARGAGIEGLAAMRERRSYMGMTWVRPLLELRRAELRAYLRDRSIDWCEDPTNDDPAYDRVKARRALEALSPLGIDIETLAASARHIARQRDVLDRAKAALADRARRWGPFGEAWLDPEPMRSDARDTALRLLAETLQRISGAPYRPRFQPLSEALDAILVGQGGGATLAGCLIRPGVDGAQALVCREPAACAPPMPLADLPIDWDGRWRVAASGAPADATVGALGEPGLAALAAAEDWDPPASWAAARRELRQTAPAIWGADGTLLAAPLAGYARTSPSGCTFSLEITPIRELP